MDKDQKGILTKDEIDLLRNTFGGEQVEALFYVRNVLLQFEVTKTFELSDRVFNVLKKYILPTLDSDLPIKSQQDLYFTLDTLKQIPPEVAYLHIKSMDKMVEYLRQRFDVLSGKENNGIILTSLKEKADKSDEERFVDMITYQSVVAYIEGSLERLKMVADSKDETEEERKKRLAQNSTK